MSLANGQSELDNVVIKLPEFNKVITNWQTYSFNQNFLKPTSEWQFTIGDENAQSMIDLLVPGTKVQLVINDLIQCTGFIDKKTIKADPNPRGGTNLVIQGRDIMAKVVESNINPQLRFSVQLSLFKIIEKALAPLGIDTIYTSDDLNFNTITGNKRSIDPDSDELNQKYLKQLKPNFGQSTFAFIDQILKRFGFMMWAAADGSGVIIGKPNFKLDPLHHITLLKDKNNVSNNVKYSNSVIDLTGQPAIIIAKGVAGGEDADYNATNCIIINELIGLDDDGIPIPEIQDILAQYQQFGSKILPLRQELIDVRKSIKGRTITGPMYVKDDEAQTSEQLQKFLIREMALRQQKIYNLDYMVVGHTQNEIPWAVNSIVSVKDEIQGIEEKMWVIEKTFSKSYSEGTTTQIKLIKPYTLVIS